MSPYPLYVRPSKSSVAAHEAELDEPPQPANMTATHIISAARRDPNSMHL
jgi:hypothetical protein